MTHAFDCSVWAHAPLPLQRSFVHQTPSDAHAVEVEAFDHAEVLLADSQTWQLLDGLAMPSE
jgi:hypothetical protein